MSDFGPWRDLTPADLLETKQAHAHLGSSMQVYQMANEILLTTLGPEWWKKNCTHIGVAGGYLRNQPESELDRRLNMDRVTRLADALWTLREEDGFDRFVTLLRSRSLEGAFFEAMAAKALSKSGFRITFIEERGEKGADYDLLAKREGVVVRVEAREKGDGTALSADSVRSTLKKARHQLPGEGCNVILLSIPTHWVRAPQVSEVMENGVAWLFRNSQRVSAVVVFWHDMLQGNETRFASFTAFKAFYNHEAHEQAPEDLVAGLRLDGAALSSCLTAESEIPEPLLPSFWNPQPRRRL